MSILDGVLGLIQGNRAANAVAVANNDAMQGVVTGQQQAVQNVNAAGDKAINAVNTATGSANDTIAGGYNKNVDLAQPYLDAGAQGVQGVRDFAANTPKFAWDPRTNMDDPAFQFRQQQGEERLKAQNALRGLLSSGNFAKDISAFTTGNAAQYEGDDFSRALQTFKTNTDTTLQPLLALAGFGQHATDTLGGQTERAYGQQADNTMTAGKFEGATTTGLAQFLAGLNADAAVNAGKFRVGQGQATAAKDINTGNAWSSIIGGIPDLLTAIPGLGGK